MLALGSLLGSRKVHLSSLLAHPTVAPQMPSQLLTLSRAFPPESRWQLAWGFGLASKAANSTFQAASDAARLRRGLLVLHMCGVSFRHKPCTEKTSCHAAIEL